MQRQLERYYTHIERYARHWKRLHLWYVIRHKSEELEIVFVPLDRVEFSLGHAECATQCHVASNVHSLRDVQLQKVKGADT